MITQESRHDLKPRKSGRFGDQSILYGAYTSSFWKTLWFENRKKAFLMLLIQYLKFNRAMMSFLFWGVFRYKSGMHTTGLMLSVTGLSFLLGYNCSALHWALKPFSLFIVPLVPFFTSPDELMDLVFVHMESLPLFAYSFIFALSALCHVVMIWFNKSNKDLTKRGESWVQWCLVAYLGNLCDVLASIRFLHRIERALRKITTAIRTCPEFLFSGLIDPGIAVMLALSVWHYTGDVYFGVFMITAALAEVSQQLLDVSYQANVKSVLSA